MATAAIVTNRSATRTIAGLSMSCDAREMPSPPPGATKSASWVAGVAAFAGPAALLAPDGSLGREQQGSIVGTAAVETTSDRFFAIVSPNDGASPAIWIAAELAGLTVTPEGQIGLIKKRPAKLKITGYGWALSLSQVEAFDREMNWSQRAQEGRLVAALGA